MFYVSSIKDNLVGITDTYDNVEEFYSPSQIKEFPSHIKINGVSSKGIKKINLGEAILTRDIVKKIECKKELSFEVVDLRDIVKYKLAGARVISDDFMLLETDTELKLISDNIILLESTKRSPVTGLFEKTEFSKIDFHNTNTSNITNMKYMFIDCKAKFIDLSSFNTSHVENMDGMFMHCQAASLDLSSFKTFNVKDMRSMFYDCKSTSINLSNFNTSNVKNMRSMFDNCQAASLDLSSFDTSKVTDMCDMFNNCQAKYIDLSNFNTSKVNDMSRMFKGCQATFLDLSSFNTSHVWDMKDIFNGYRGIAKITDKKLLQAYNERELG